MTLTKFGCEYFWNLARKSGKAELTENPKRLGCVGNVYPFEMLTGHFHQSGYIYVLSAFKNISVYVENELADWSLYP